MNRHESQVHQFGHSIDMDIVKYINDHKRTCKAESEQGVVVKPTY